MDCEAPAAESVVAVSGYQMLLSEFRTSISREIAKCLVASSELRAIVRAPMGELDVTFRHLLRGLPRPILKLAFPGRSLEPIGPPLDPSLDRLRPRTADNLFRVRADTGEVAVHIEAERDWESDLPRRLFEYASAAVMATGLPVWSAVVLFKRGKRPPRDAGVYRIPGADGEAFVFRYQVVQLWQLDARQMRAYLGPAGAPFCVAMSGADEELVRSLAEWVSTTPDLSEQDRRTTMRLMFYVTVAILGSKAAKRIFHMESLIQDPNVQELVRELKDEGRAEEARSLLYKVLALRSFPVTPDVRARIDGEPDVGRIESWHDAAVTAAAIGDVFRDG